MKQMVLRFGRLFVGLFLYAVGIVLTINANIGLAPWDVFHQGLALHTGLTMGQASIMVGMILVVIDFALGEHLGWGTLCNMVFIGLFMDLIMLNELLPVATSMVMGIWMLLLGIVVIAIASYFYIGAGLGSGPRDGLMVALTKRTHKSVRLIRNSIELSALIVGYLLGGLVGLGTLIIALSLGPIMQFTFKVFRFDVKNIKHRFIDEDIRAWKEKIGKRKDQDMFL